MSKIKGFGYGAVFVADFEKSLNFYVDLLGFQKDWLNGKHTAMLSAGNFKLFLHSKRRKSSDKKAMGPLVHLHLEVDAIDKYFSELKKRGLKTRAVPKTSPWGHRSFHVKDPDGVEWELYSVVK